jgi:hypothetical protein
MVSDNSLQALRQRLARNIRPGACDESGVRRLWWAALEILQEELLDRHADNNKPKNTKKSNNNTK